MTAHSPPEILTGTIVPDDRCGCCLSGRPSHSSRRRRTASRTTAHLLDRVHRAAGLPVRLGHLGVPGPALDRDGRRERAAARHPDLERRRLRHDAGVGADAVPRCGQAAGARRLLVGDGVHDHVAGEPHAQPREHLGRVHHARDAALHVARAAAVQVAVAHLGLVRVARPALARVRRDDVDVAVQEQARGRRPRRRTGRRAAGARRRPGRRGSGACRRRRPGPAPRCPRRRPPGPAARRGRPAGRPPARAGSSGSRAVVSKPISVDVSSTSSSRPAATSSRMRCSSVTVGDDR